MQVCDAGKGCRSGRSKEKGRERRAKSCTSCENEQVTKCKIRLNAVDFCGVARERSPLERLLNVRERGEY